MSIHCPHCRATVGSLKVFTRHLETGVRLQVVQCIICGWEVSRPKPHEALLRLTQKPPVGPQVVSHPVLPPRTVDKRRRKHPRHPCTRIGCTGTYAKVARTKFHLCATCSRRVQAWKSRGMETPPPLINVDGKWYAPHELKGENA